MNNRQAATEFIKALKTISQKPKNLDNFECYLSCHFDEWLKKWGNTPEKITSELKQFAEMEI
jgi:hypothetical protein